MAAINKRPLNSFFIISSLYAGNPDAHPDGVSCVAGRVARPDCCSYSFSRTFPVKYVGDSGEVGVGNSWQIFYGILAGDLQGCSPRRHPENSRETGVLVAACSLAKQGRRRRRLQLWPQAGA